MATKQQASLLSKVPEVTLFFWLIKVLCTTVGETFSDFLSLNLGIGLFNTTIIMGIVFAVVLFFQFKSPKYNPGLYWLTVVLISVFGTLVTDNLTDIIGVPLEISTLVFSGLLGATFVAWYLSEKTLSIHSIYTSKRELFYWLTILFTFALGTAFGDLYSEQLGMGYFNTGVAVGALIGLMFVLWKFFKLDSVISFWIAYIFTRPLGASIGDFLSQPPEFGGLGFGTTITSILFLTAILGVIIYLAVSKIDRIKPVQNNSGKQSVMPTKKPWAQTFITIALLLILVFGSYSVLNHNNIIKSEASQTTFSDELKVFITIENEMIQAVNANDFQTDKAIANDLERQWDAKASLLKNMDKTAWTEIDNSIDDVLAANRKGSPDVSSCLSSLNQSLGVMSHY